MKKKTQLIAAAVAVVCAGAPVAAQACGECGLHRTSYIESPAPVGERVVTRTIIRRQPEVLMTTRTTRMVVEEPAPVGEYIAPEGGYVETAPGAGETFARVVTAPIRWAGDIVTAPFRAFRREPVPEPVAERVLVTRTTTFHNGCATKRIHRLHHARYLRHTPAPVAERTVIIRRQMITQY